MKAGKLLIALLALSFLVSCSKKEEGQKGASEIMNDYTKTLSTAPSKARDAERASGERDEKMKKAIEELDR